MKQPSRHSPGRPAAAGVAHPSTNVRHYATYFDRHYLPKGLALYRSLERHSPPFVLWVLCLDEETEQALSRMRLEHMRLIPLEELEQADPALLAVKPERSLVEYYWTSGPVLLLHLLGGNAQIEMLTYLDADLFFFGDPEPTFEMLGSNSILIIERRVRNETQWGKYNVGLLVFRRTPSGTACLERWREQCLEWCFDRFEPGRHGDQAYLDEWPKLYDVTVPQYGGIGVGSMNVTYQQIEYKSGQVLVEGDPLISYHFNRVFRINRWVYEMHDFEFNRVKAHPVVRRHIFAPYVRELYAAEQQILEVGGCIHAGTARDATALGEVLRRRRAADAPRLSLARYHRFMFVMGPLVL